MSETSDERFVILRAEDEDAVQMKLIAVSEVNRIFTVATCRHLAALCHANSPSPETICVISGPHHWLPMLNDSHSEDGDIGIMT